MNSTRSTLLHLRIPFSFFLLPVYLFALSISTNYQLPDALLVFFIVHFLLYPASNGYNSYFDRDEGSIGGLEHPPPVSRQLYYVALALDAVAIALGALISGLFAGMLLIYGLVSKAYSHPSVRLKKYAVVSWLVAGFFQGFFTVLMVYVGVNRAGLADLAQPTVWGGALLTSLMLWGSYPMTQIYQHEEDRQRGDTTLSYRLGVRGTFHFTAVLFILTIAGFWRYYQTWFVWWEGGVFVLFLLPVLGYFVQWYLKVRKDPSWANFRGTMRLNFISGLCLNAFFLLTVFLHRG
ncbi:MAG: UbiA family prenyltransferase [Tunicatimonas sp.]